MNQLRLEIERAATSSAAYGGGIWTRSFLFSSDFCGFSGHFPGRPILPAIVQMMLAIATAESATQQTMTLEGIQNAKFLLPLKPDMEITVHCEPVAGEWNSIKVRLLTQDGTASSFQLGLHTSANLLAAAI